MQRGFVLDSAPDDLPLPGNLGVFIVVQRAQECDGPVACINAPVVERPESSRVRFVQDLDLAAGSLMHVQPVAVTARGSVQCLELAAVTEDTQVSHVDVYFRLRETTARGFGILPVTGIEISGLELPDRFYGFDP